MNSQHVAAKKRMLKVEFAHHVTQVNCPYNMLQGKLMLQVDSLLHTINSLLNTILINGSVPICHVAAGCSPVSLDSTSDCTAVVLLGGPEINIWIL